MSEPLASQLPLLLYLSVCSIVVTALLRKQPQKQRNLKLAIGVATALFAVKLAYETQGDPANYYSILGTSRHSSFMGIRQAYKRISLKLHPDKNLRPEANEEFQLIQDIYEILSDDKLRDVYNRFGETAINSDPRLDEFSLIIKLFRDFLYWALMSFIVTIPRGSSGCRTWIILCILAITGVSVVFQLTDVNLQDFAAITGIEGLISYLTEYDFVRGVHRIYPFILIIFVVMSEYWYVDTDELVVQVLKDMITSQKEMTTLLHDLQNDMNRSLKEGSNGIDRNLIEKRLITVKSKLADSNSSILESVDALTQKSGGILQSTPWIILALIFGASYIFSSN